MFFRFLGTKIGISLIIAIFIVLGAFSLKLRSEKTVEKDGLASKIGLVADQSVQKALENGQLDTAEWEKTLNIIQNGSTTDEKITDLSKNIETYGSIDKPLTATDRFAQKFLTEYIKIKKTGAEIDETTTINLVNKLLAEDYGSAEPEKTYTLEDISISNEQGPVFLKYYANTIGDIMSTPLPKGYENEVVILNRVYENNSDADLEKMAQNIDRYKKILAEIAETTVPKSLAKAHVALLNSLSTIIDGVEGMRLIPTDPIGSAKLVQGYEAGIQALDLTTREISAYLKRQKIVFLPSESGYIFVK